MMLRSVGVQSCLWVPPACVFARQCSLLFNARFRRHWRHKAAASGTYFSFVTNHKHGFVIPASPSRIWTNIIRKVAGGSPSKLGFLSGKPTGELRQCVEGDLRLAIKLSVQWDQPAGAANPRAHPNVLRPRPARPVGAKVRQRAESHTRREPARETNPVVISRPRTITANGKGPGDPITKASH